VVLVLLNVCAEARENGFTANTPARIAAATGPALTKIDFDRNIDISAVIDQAKAMGTALPPAEQAKSAAVTDHETGKIILEDVTKQCMYQDEVVSAFPELYDRIPKEENADIRKVFNFYENGIKEESKLRRIEFFYTGGDWMRYGLTYFITNAGNKGHTPGVYFMKDLSTSDGEEGATPPEVDPFNDAALQNYILTRFLDPSGKTKPELSPLFY